MRRANNVSRHATADDRAEPDADYAPELHIVAIVEATLEIAANALAEARPTDARVDGHCLPSTDLRRALIASLLAQVDALAASLRTYRRLIADERTAWSRRTPW